MLEAGDAGPQVTGREAGGGVDGAGEEALAERAVGDEADAELVEDGDDVVFTVEYSVRNAASAVYSLLGLEREPPPVYKGQYDPRVLFKAFKGLHDLS